MKKPTRVYEIGLTPLIFETDEEPHLVDPARTFDVRGTDVHTDVGGGIDYFHVKDAYGAIVFSVPSHMVRYCIQKQNKNVKRSVKVLKTLNDGIK